MRKVMAYCLVIVLVASLPMAASAHRRHHHGHYPGGYGVYLEAPLWWGPTYYYAGPYDYLQRAPTVVVGQQPTIYVQRPRVVATPRAEAEPATLWFYCADPAGYYPYVEHCTSPWVTVDPDTVAEAPAR